MDEEIARRHALARRVAVEAGALALAHWRNRAALAVEAKASPQDIVSEADRAVERLIRAAIAADFPEDGILGEELGADDGRSGFTWVIDPIDGTAPYLHGLPSWCVAIAVARGAETLIGAIHVPVQEELFAASLGGGAWLNGARLRLSPELTLRNAAVGVGASYRSDPPEIARIVERLLAAGSVFYRNGSGALMLASVAAGRLAGYVEPHMNAWDCLAALLMIREAGGRTAPFPAAGDLRAGGPVLAAAPGAWEALSAVVHGGLPEGCGAPDAPPGRGETGR